MNPKISVVIPIYNCSPYLEEAIDSILRQSFAEFEILAVNDGSTDDSLAILKKLRKKDSRLNIVNQSNQGIVGALNNGCQRAQGEYLARMDGDDISYPKRFEKQLKFLEQNPDHCACGTHVYFVDTEGQKVKKCPRPLSNESIEEQLYQKADGGSIIHPTLFARRKAIQEAGFYREEAIWIEDLDLYYRLSNIGKLANIDEYLLDYRVRPGSVTYSKIEKKNEKKKWIIKQALQQRNLPLSKSDEILARSTPYSPPYEKHIDWAVTALDVSGKKVALKHALQGLKIRPFSLRSWSTLKYVLTR